MLTLLCLNVLYIRDVVDKQGLYAIHPILRRYVIKRMLNSALMSVCRLRGHRILGTLCRYIVKRTGGGLASCYKNIVLKKRSCMLAVRVADPHMYRIVYGRKI